MCRCSSVVIFFFQAEDGIRDLVRSRGLGDVYKRQDYLCLTISDNGIGFNSEIPSANNGVKNIRSRSKTLGGTSEINTSIGNGTQWKIKIPLTVTK